MKIDPNRISRDIEAVAGFSEVAPSIGYSRPTFTPAWAGARDYVIAEAQKIGCSVRIDAAANVHLRPKSLPADKKVWLSGSHIDSVPTGGKYDGVMGIVAPLEVLRVHPNAPLELIIFAEEEGSTFNLGMLGSRAWAGTLSADEMGKLKNKAGVDPLTAGKPYGLDPTRFEQDRLNPGHYLGLIEIHAEQGVGMWRNQVPLAVVTAIAGRQQYKAKFLGKANHAGSTAMSDRSDALVVAARVITFVEKMANDFGHSTVATVGQISCEPNAINVIPAVVRMTIDFRSPDAAILAEGRQLLEEYVMAYPAPGGFNFGLTEELPPVPLNKHICARLNAAAERVTGAAIPTAVSGALHDSAILAPLLPTAMLFVASEDGISHNPAEFSRIEDIALATQILAEVVTERVKKPVPLSTLNEMTREQFVGVCGGFFEHSPWIADRTWAHRPFATLEGLHTALVATVAAATEPEQVGLIAAHPDLVGRLAREGKLTHESTAEQRAAGLAGLSEAEVAAFDRYNGQYRTKFGFPFVICARENKKEAILAAFPTRLANNTSKEIQTALAEIAKIAKLRLLDAISEQ